MIFVPKLKESRINDGFLYNKLIHTRNHLATSERPHGDGNEVDRQTEIQRSRLLLCAASITKSRTADCDVKLQRICNKDIPVDEWRVAVTWQRSPIKAG